MALGQPAKRHFRVAVLSLAIVCGGLVGYTRLHFRFRDRQGTGRVRDIIISRNAGDGGLLCLRRIGSGADIGDRRRGAERVHDRCRVVGHFTAHRIRTLQRAAVIRLACRRGGDSDLDLVIEGDHIAVGIHRDGLGRVAAHLQAVGAERFKEARCSVCCVLGSDGGLSCNIHRDLGRGALQVMVDRYRSHVKLPDRVQIDDSAVGVGQILDGLLIGVHHRSAGGGAPAEELVVGYAEGVGREGLFFVVLELFVIHRARGGGAGGRVGIEADLVLDRIPLGVHGVVRIAIHHKLVCRYLDVLVAVFIVLIIFNEKNFRRRCFCFGVFFIANPALELISCAGRDRVRHRHRLIDGQVCVFANSSAVVVIPVDVGLDFLVFFNIDRLQLHGISVRLIFIKIRHRDDIIVFIRDSCIICKHREGVSREDIHTGVNKSCAVPLLYRPVTENIVFLVSRFGRRVGDRLGLVDIDVAVCRCVGPAGCVINNVNAAGSNQLAAPLSVEIDLADGGGIRRIDLGSRIELAVLFDHRLIKGKDVKVERLLHRLVGVPADKIEVNSLAADIADLLAVLSPEKSCLGLTVILDRISGAVVGVKLNLVLALSPLGIQRHVVSGHLVKDDLFAGAVFVVIPAQEYEAVISRRGIISGDVRFIIDILLLGKLCALDRVDRISAAVYKDTVVVGDVIHIAGIAEIKIILIFDAGCGRAVRPASIASYTICVERIANISFRGCPLSRIIIPPPVSASSGQTSSCY